MTSAACSIRQQSFQITCVEQKVKHVTSSSLRICSSAGGVVMGAGAAGVGVGVGTRSVGAGAGFGEVGVGVGCACDDGSDAFEGDAGLAGRDGWSPPDAEEAADLF
jgi:hypothetical protein